LRSNNIILQGRSTEIVRKVILTLLLVVVLLAVFASPVAASDHLFNAAHSEGVDNRGFVNPVAGNPSGTSGAMALPGTVPGEGDPKVDVQQGTPAVDLNDVWTRSGGQGDPQKP